MKYEETTISYLFLWDKLKDCYILCFNEIRSFSKDGAIYRHLCGNFFNSCRAGSDHRLSGWRGPNISVFYPASYL